MLKEYLLSQSVGLWSDSMPGVQVCRFQAPESAETFREFPVQGEPLHFEALFCLSGRLVAEPLHGPLKALEAPGIFLLSDCSQLRSCRCSKNLSGILIAADALPAQGSLQAICQALEMNLDTKCLKDMMRSQCGCMALFGTPWPQAFFETTAQGSLQAICQALEMNLDTKCLKDMMRSQCGCMALFGTPWPQAFFETIQDLPADAQNRYCIFKLVELLYLLCSKVPAPDSHGAAYPVPASMLEIKAYLDAHLSEKITISILCKQFSVSPTFLKEGFRRTYEKITISILCKQFSVSPTFLKEGFRRTYGVPIHAYLIQQRLQRAQKLIRTTRMPIQRIAQTVGYEGMTQFHVAFKQHYGMTPGQYRKMSETASACPF